MTPKSKGIAKAFLWFFLRIIVATIIFCFIKFWLEDHEYYTKVARFILALLYGIALVISYRYISKEIDKYSEK